MVSLGPLGVDYKVRTGAHGLTMSHMKPNSSRSLLLQADSSVPVSVLP